MTLQQAFERRRARFPYATESVVRVPRSRQKVRFSQVFWESWAALGVIVVALGFMVSIKTVFQFIEGVTPLGEFTYWVCLIGFLVACLALSVSVYQDATREEEKNGSKSAS